MFLLRGLIDRILLVTAVVAGGLVPGFIAQYRQRLGGRLDQALADLAPWQRIADQHHHGDLDELIRYHLNSSDSTFQADGVAIQKLVSAVHRLQEAVEALRGSLIHQCGFLLTHIDLELARATLQDWVPTFSISAQGLAFCIAFALLVWTVFQLLWLLIGSIAGRLRTRSRPTA